MFACHNECMPSNDRRSHCQKWPSAIYVQNSVNNSPCTPLSHGITRVDYAKAYAKYEQSYTDLLPCIYNVILHVMPPTLRILEIAMLVLGIARLVSGTAMLVVGIARLVLGTARLVLGIARLVTGIARDCFDPEHCISCTKSGFRV